ncbi:unnamed protein product, partial [Didymodactylos carnosus]
MNVPPTSETTTILDEPIRHLSLSQGDAKRTRTTITTTSIDRGSND